MSFAQPNLPALIREIENLARSIEGKCEGVTNRVNWTTQRIIVTYSQRWPIETFYQDGKERLGLDEYRTRDAEAIQKH